MSEVIADLRLHYPNFGLDVALRLPGNGVSVLFGPSGSGKTTILRALAGLERAQGRVLVQGQVWQDEHRFLPAHQRPVGYVFQEANLFPHLSVRRNLDYGLKRVAMPDRRVKFDDAVQLLGIEHLLDRMPDKLSGGERQRVGIARALLTSPRLLLMDEPLSALDSARKAEILPYLERLSRQANMPIVYVTHSVDEAARLGDYFVLIEAGRIQADGPLADTLARLDLPLSQAADASAVLTATVSLHDLAFGQSQLDLDGGLSIWVGLSDAKIGQQVRVKVMARDVSVALSRAHDSSITNILPASISAMRCDDANTALLQLRLCGSAQCVLARVTKRSSETLQLHEGKLVFAQIKGVSLLPAYAAMESLLDCSGAAAYCSLLSAPT